MPTQYTESFVDNSEGKQLRIKADEAVIMRIINLMSGVTTLSQALSKHNRGGESHPLTLEANMAHKYFNVGDYDKFIESQIPEIAYISNAGTLVTSIREQNTPISRRSVARAMAVLGSHIPEEERKPRLGSTMCRILDSHSPEAVGPYGASLGDAGNPVLVITHAFSFKTVYFKDTLIEKHSLRDYVGKFRVSDPKMRLLVNGVVGSFSKIVPVIPTRYFDPGMRANQHIAFEEPGGVIQVVVQHSFNAPTFYQLNNTRSVKNTDALVASMLVYNELNYRRLFDERLESGHAI